MYRAQPVTREQLPRAYAVVERLTAKMGIPMPKMYVIPAESRMLLPQAAIRACIGGCDRRHPEPVKR